LSYYTKIGFRVYISDIMTVIMLLSKLYKKYHYSLILLRELVITEFKLRYQGSVLGYFWSLLKPLFLFVILYFVFVYFLRVGEGIPHWPVAMLVGIVLWTFFSEVTNNGLNSIVARGDVIRKINFPKYVIVFASSISALINLVLNFIIIAIFMIISGVDLQWSALLTPLFIFEIFAFGIGLAFILSALQVRLRDTSYIWEIVMQALFYGSAVLYPITMVIDQNLMLAKILMLNPVAQAIQDVRHMLISEQNATLQTISDGAWWSVIPFVLVLVILIVGALYFKRRSPYFAEEV